MDLTVGKLYDYIDNYAPFDLAEDDDNVGLLAGSRETILTGVVLVVDVNIDAVKLAIETNSNLIISHHPVIFGGINTVTDETATGKVLQMAIKNEISIISAHTNLDAADKGVSMTLAELVGLENIYTPRVSNMMRVGEFNTPVAFEDFVSTVKNKLNIDSVFVSRKSPERIKSVAVVSGRGCSLLYEAKETGADIFLLGEIKHENAVYADILDMCIISCGHHETEVIILDRLKTYLQNKLNGLQLNLGVYDKAPMLKK